MDDDITLKEYVAIIRKYWGSVLIAFLIVFIAIASYTYFSTPIYSSKSMVALTTQDQANFILGSSAPKASDINTQIVIIQSPAVMAPIYAKYGIDTFKLTVSEIKNSNIIEINVEAANPKDAVNIADGVAESYMNYTAASRRQDAENNIEFITNKINSFDQELSELDIRINQYKADEEGLTREERALYQNLQREMAAKSKIYDYLLTKREEAGLTANMESANIKLIQAATYPEFPTKPNKPLNLVLGFLLALGAGAVTATLIDSKADARKK